MGIREHEAELISQEEHKDRKYRDSPKTWQWLRIRLNTPSRYLKCAFPFWNFFSVNTLITLCMLKNGIVSEKGHHFGKVVRHPDTRVTKHWSTRKRGWPLVYCTTGTGSGAHSSVWCFESTLHRTHISFQFSGKSAVFFPLKELHPSPPDNCSFCVMAEVNKKWFWMFWWIISVVCTWGFALSDLYSASCFFSKAGLRGHVNKVENLFNIKCALLFHFTASVLQVNKQ